jgi:uncharacterized protein YuzE
MSAVRSFNVQYDKDSDVLYISSRDAPASKGIEEPQGMVWRYDPRGDLIGLTLINFHDYWRLRRPELVHDISIKFEMPAPQAEHLLDRALSGE